MNVIAKIKKNAVSRVRKNPRKIILKRMKKMMKLMKKNRFNEKKVI